LLHPLAVAGCAKPIKRPVPDPGLLGCSGAGAGEDGQVAECVFCEIANGDRQAHVIFADTTAIAFLDSRPVFKGHVLLIPRAHVPTFADLADSCVGPFFVLARQLAIAVEVGLEAAGSFVAMNNRVSQSVPHLHVHIVPRNRKDGLRGFFWPRTKYESEDEARDYARRIRAALHR
jgi:histidine triad (HIT) family protein